MCPDDETTPTTPTPENLDADGVVLAIPPSMLLPRIVPVPESLGTKEEHDPTKRVVVEYDPFMDVVNGLAGSNSGASRRISEILHKAVDRDAVSQFSQVIQQANIEGQDIGRQAATAAYADELASLNDEITRLNAAVGEEAGKADELYKQVDTLTLNLKTAEEERLSLVDNLKTAHETIARLEKELEEAKLPAAARAKKADEQANGPKNGS
jgi:flagellar biosynthesis chaperone FliJ